MREWQAFAYWVRDGETFPNVLGHGSSTPIGSLISGEIGGGGQAQAKVPTWFHGDMNVEKSARVYWAMSKPAKNAICGVWVNRMSEQRTADEEGVSRRQIRNGLNEAYQALWDVLCGERTNTEKGGFASG